MSNSKEMTEMKEIRREEMNEMKEGREGKEKYVFHVLSLPHTVTTPEYNACAYTMKVLKFCKMMKERGHYIIHYGHKDSIVECDEMVALLDNDDLKQAYGSYDWKKNFFVHNCSDHCHMKFNRQGIVEVSKRIKKTDFVLPFWGKGHLPIVEYVKNNKLGTVVEPGIGYHDSFCDFRVFESWAIAHHTWGLQNIYKPSWYQVVIPNYFDPEEFEYSSEKEDYYLCLGRIIPCKGVHIAIQATAKLGKRLVIAGQGDIAENLGYDDKDNKIPSNVEYVGYADVEKRKKLMSKAKAVFLLSDYVEPFGGVAVEAMLSGTPVIVPPWGVYNETVLHGITGYRVSTFEHITWAIENIDKIKPINCREWALNNYSLDKVSKMYEEYFYQLSNLQRKGWYEPNPARTELDWNHRTYPSH